MTFVSYNSLSACCAFAGGNARIALQRLSSGLVGMRILRLREPNALDEGRPHWRAEERGSNPPACPFRAQYRSPSGRASIHKVAALSRRRHFTKLVRRDPTSCRYIPADPAFGPPSNTWDSPELNSEMGAAFGPGIGEGARVISPCRPSHASWLESDLEWEPHLDSAEAAQMARQPPYTLGRLISSVPGTATDKPRAHPYQLRDASHRLVIPDSRRRQRC